MTLVVLCPNCSQRYEVADEQAGGTATCPACGTVARIPAMDRLATRPSSQRGESGYPPDPPPGAADSAGPAYAGWDQRGVQPVARLQVHLILVGVFNLVVGGVSAFWGLLMLVEAHLFSIGGIPLDPRGPPKEVMADICIVLGVLSFGTAVLQLLAGIAVLRRWSRCRVVGIISGVVGCMSLWQCCAYLFSLATGIYTLAILFGREAKEVLGGYAAAAQPDEFLRDDG